LINLCGVGAGELTANRLTGYVARESVEIERNSQPLLACHSSVPFDLPV